MSTDEQLLRDSGPLGAAFRAGARAEARIRTEDERPHAQLIDYVRELSKVYPHWTDGQIAREAAKVFFEG